MSEPNGRRFCALRAERVRPLPATLDPRRAQLIRQHRAKWVNGTTLRFYFFDSERWKPKNSQQLDTVRKAFQVWKSLGIGLDFREVDSRAEAEIRIGFMKDDGSWSYIGRGILEQGTSERTMNIGWDIADDLDTALHEIGHTLGFAHEHQNPFAGIVWNEDAVYSALAKPPNKWNREKTFDNIIRKLKPEEVNGSNWDPDSIMHYPFEAGLIAKPKKYANGLAPKGGISSADKAWVLQFYPRLQARKLPVLQPFESVPLALSPGEQRDFWIEPDETRRYEIQTFGKSDTVLVLFEDVGGEFRYVSGDDDSGTEQNAHLGVKLMRGRRYIARLRHYCAHTRGQFAIMLS